MSTPLSIPSPIPSSMSAASTWVELLRRRAAETPGRVAYRFLDSGEGETASLTMAALDRRARAIAVALAGRVSPGDRVVLAHPPGPEFVAALFGCWYAGGVAVPTFPPRTNGNGHRMTERARAIVGHAAPAVVLTVAADVDKITAALPGNTVLASDTLPDAADAAWRAPALTPGSLACLQYTSGTSGAPKGVMLTHAALLANCRQIADRFQTTPDSTAVVWLPPYHDMGLVGGILEPLYVGFEVVLMPPAAFLAKPARWLRAVSQYRATHSGGPCFAFGLCTANVPDADLTTLDLSAWRVAFTGAETVRADVVNAFAARFAACGFDARGLLPCYGMAETTLIVSGVRPGVGIRQAFADDAAAPPVRHVSCGPVVAPAEAVVVDPVTRLVLPDGRVGELWTRGPSVARGYWNDAEATAAAFAGRLAGTSCDAGDPFVRTGDLAFLRDGELFVTGRLKELVIVRGVNHAPHELERTAEAGHPAVQPQGAAAFAVEGESGEALGLAVELQRAHRHADPAEVIAAVRAAVAAAHGLEAHTVVLLRPGGLPRTPSGKVQRSACRAMLAAGEFDPIAAHTLTPRPADAAATADPEHPASPAAADLQTWLIALLANTLNTTPDAIDPAQPLGGYGLGSADAVGFAGTVSVRLGIDLPATTLWDYPTAADLATYLAEQLAAGVRAEAA